MTDVIDMFENRTIPRLRRALDAGAVMSVGGVLQPVERSRPFAVGDDDRLVGAVVLHRGYFLAQLHDQRILLDLLVGWDGESDPPADFEARAEEMLRGDLFEDFEERGWEAESFVSERDDGFTLEVAIDCDGVEALAEELRWLVGQGTYATLDQDDLAASGS